MQMSLESLQKVIEELVNNAFKFSKVGALVQIDAGQVNDTYQWTIRDHGRGMSPEQIANLGAGMQFERHLFEQQGGGLGFAIARQLVELYSGVLTIESRPGVQTTVRVILPLA